MGSSLHPAVESDSRGGVRRSWARRVVVAAAVVLAIGPLAHSFGKQEVARWYWAAGYERLLQDDLDGALARIDRALTWNPRNTRLKITRASWKLQNGDAVGAIEDCELALRLARSEHASHQTFGTQNQLAAALNLSAYAHALAGIKLEEALADVQEAIELRGPGDFNLRDTRGYIYLLLGDLPAAQLDLVEAVRLAESSYQLEQSQLRQIKRDLVDKRPAEQLEKNLTDGLAILYHHRGELYEKLGREQDAISDLRRAKRLGYDPARGVW